MWWVLLTLAGCTPPDPYPACQQAPAGQVSLPADDSQHDQPVEWWYWTGHLRDAQGNWYGFEHTFFAISMGNTDVKSVHTALTDVAGGTFDPHIVYTLGTYPAQPADGFDLSIDGQTAKGGGGHDLLHAAFDDVGWDLSLHATKAPVLQHGDGYHQYAQGGYTWYYSRERLAAAGTVDVGGQARAVIGQAWFDHQWGDLTAATNAGWDWFGIQLDDRREIMLFLLRGTDSLVGGSISDADCTQTEIDPSTLTVTPLGTWTSPHTGCTYPEGWDVAVGDLHLHITPDLADQEMYNPYETYWEGASTVTGDATGRAYVELTGYCASTAP